MAKLGQLTRWYRNYQRDYRTRNRRNPGKLAGMLEYDEYISMRSELKNYGITTNVNRRILQLQTPMAETKLEREYDAYKTRYNSINQSGRSMQSRLTKTEFKMALIDQRRLYTSDETTTQSIVQSDKVLSDKQINKMMLAQASSGVSLYTRDELNSITMVMQGYKRIYYLNGELVKGIFELTSQVYQGVGNWGS